MLDQQVGRSKVGGRAGAQPSSSSRSGDGVGQGAGSAARQWPACAAEAGALWSVCATGEFVVLGCGGSGEGSPF